MIAHKLELFNLFLNTHHLRVYAQNKILVKYIIGPPIFFFKSKSTRLLIIKRYIHKLTIKEYSSSLAIYIVQQSTFHCSVIRMVTKKKYATHLITC